MAYFDIEIGPHLRLFNIVLKIGPDGRPRSYAPRRSTQTLRNKSLTRRKPPRRSEQPMHIAEFKQAAILLSFAIKPLGIRKLKGNSLTAPDRNRAVRLHDVVHAPSTEVGALTSAPSNWSTAGHLSC